MNLATPIPREEKMRIAGELIGGDRAIEVRNPYNGQVVGTVPKASIEQLRAAYDKVAAYKPTP
jgi:aldehyde dehydrogenase (NAD+)